MAFLKYANAKVVHHNIQQDKWADIRTASTIPFSKDAKVVLGEYNPKEFLLTHCTIVASVDTENGPGPLGKQVVEGMEIDRRWQDYYITPKTAEFINNNNDSFSRKALLNTYRTFIGAENYLEHLQIPAMSKGKIIDAVARDIGPSVYIDILVGTNRKHAALIEAITSGKLQTLSMGCSVTHTTCTKCGNVAEDETQLCFHIRQFKGSDFYDALGNKRKVAELCGHSTDPKSVKFIEASWVANPAFKGAVLRSILSPETIEALKTAGVFQYEEPSHTNYFSFGTQKAASTKNGIIIAKSIHLGQDQFSLDDFGGETPADGDSSKTEEKKEDPLEKAVEDITTAIRDRVVKKIKEQVTEENKPKEPASTLPDPNQNDTLIKSALAHKEWTGIANTLVKLAGNHERAKNLFLGMLFHKQGGWAKVASAGYTGKELLAISRVLDLASKRPVIAGEGKLYSLVLRVGGIKKHGSTQQYLNACETLLGRKITTDETRILLEKGLIYDFQK